MYFKYVFQILVFQILYNTGGEYRLSSIFFSVVIDHEACYITISLNFTLQQNCKTDAYDFFVIGSSGRYCVFLTILAHINLKLFVYPVNYELLVKRDKHSDTIESFPYFLIFYVNESADVYIVILFVSVFSRFLLTVANVPTLLSHLLLRCKSSLAFATENYHHFTNRRTGWPKKVSHFQVSSLNRIKNRH